MSQTLTAEIAARFADIALGHLTREYPNKLDHVLTGPQDLRSPRELHPIFFGWRHSCRRPRAGSRRHSSGRRPSAIAPMARSLTSMA